MPSRFFTGLILLFWVVSSGWFVYTELLHRFVGGDPPPFTIDLADEARRLSPTIEWKILRGGKQVGRVMTSIKYLDANDSFELTGTVHDLDLGKVGLVQISQMKNSYRVTREGKLLAVNTEATLRFAKGVDFKVLLDGHLKGNSFYTSVHFGDHNIDLAPVPMSARGSALSPLHPIDRIHGLSLGMSWRIILVDPVRDALLEYAGKALGGLVPQTSVTYLQAHVLPEFQTLEWGGQEESCFVIQYTGESVQAQTWVRAHDGTVLRQEARFNDEDLILERVK